MVSDVVGIGARVLGVGEVVSYGRVYFLVFFWVRGYGVEGIGGEGWRSLFFVVVVWVIGVKGMLNRFRRLRVLWLVK